MSHTAAIKKAEQSNEPLVINSLVDQIRRVASIADKSGIPCEFQLIADVVFVKCNSERINRNIALCDDDAIERLTVLLSDLQLATPVTAAMINIH